MRKVLVLGIIFLKFLPAVCPPSDTGPANLRSPLNVLGPAERRADFEQLKAWFIKNYGPHEWKLRPPVSFNLLDRSQDAKRIEAMVDPKTSDLEYAEMLVDWVGQLKDVHSQLRFPSSYQADLNLHADWIGGQVVIAEDAEDCGGHIRGRIPVRGDIVVKFDDEPAKARLESLYRYIPGGTPVGRLRLAAQMLTLRRQSEIPLYGLPARFCSDDLSQLCAKLEFKRGSETFTSEFRWLRSGTRLAFQAPWKEPAAERPDAAPTTNELWTARTQAMAPEPYRTRAEATIGTSRMPAWEVLKTQFPGSVEYVPENRNLKKCESVFCGVVKLSSIDNALFVRIPTFARDERVSNEARIQEMANFVSEQGARARAIIVDVSSNPGGQIPLADTMARLFTGCGFYPPGFQIRATEQWVRAFDAKIQGKADGDTGNADEGLIWIRNEIYKRTFDPRGKTGPVPLSEDGYAPVPENNRNLRKPIFVAVDDLTASAAEYFAALFQFNKLGRVVGTTTLGAGGSVGKYSGLTYTGAEVEITESLMSRMPASGDGLNPLDIIENTGVKPDVSIDFHAPTSGDAQVLRNLLQPLALTNYKCP